MIFNNSCSHLIAVHWIFCNTYLILNLKVGVPRLCFDFKTNIPIMLMHPFAVAAVTLSIKALVPAANLSNSKTPTGPFHTITRAFATAAQNNCELFGPQSRP